MMTGYDITLPVKDADDNEIDGLTIQWEYLNQPFARDDGVGRYIVSAGSANTQGNSTTTNASGIATIKVAEYSTVLITCSEIGLSKQVEVFDQDVNLADIIYTGT